MLSWLPWEEATEAAAATAALWAGAHRSTRRWASLARPWARELTLILILYAMWQYAGAWSLGRSGAAVQRGRIIWDIERALRVPSERTAQALVLHERALVYAFNVYYAAVHVPALGVCLVWLFVRHRDQYPRVRTVVALVTGACLAIQLFPVAPPRLIPRLGLVDTGATVGPSVYSRGAPGLDQLSAMPSVHVAWAIIVAGSIVWVCRSRWRWLALAYPVMTTITVVVTGNHYWADGAVALALCAVATLAVWKAYSLRLFVPAASQPTDLLDALEAGPYRPFDGADQPPLATNTPAISAPTATPLRTATLPADLGTVDSGTADPGTADPGAVDTVGADCVAADTGPSHVVATDTVGADCVAAETGPSHVVASGVLVAKNDGHRFAGR